MRQWEIKEGAVYHVTIGRSLRRVRVDSISYAVELDFRRMKMSSKVAKYHVTDIRTGEKLVVGRSAAFRGPCKDAVT